MKSNIRKEFIPKYIFIRGDSIQKPCNLICTTRCAFDAIHLHRDLPECSTMRSAEDKMKGILPYMIKRKIRIRRAKKAEKRNG